MSATTTDPLTWPTAAELKQIDGQIEEGFDAVDRLKIRVTGLLAPFGEEGSGARRTLGPNGYGTLVLYLEAYETMLGAALRDVQGIRNDLRGQLWEAVLLENEADDNG